MIEVKRDDFFVESIKNPIEYGTYYKINPKYGTGFQWTSEVHHDFIITATDIRFNQETMVGEHIGSGYVLALYISGAGDEFYPYQNISPNTLRCYEPSEKYKVQFFLRKSARNCPPSKTPKVSEFCRYRIVKKSRSSGQFVKDFSTVILSFTFFYYAA
jgi:hypothetical protein